MRRGRSSSSIALRLHTSTIRSAVTIMTPCSIRSSVASSVCDLEASSASLSRNARIANFRSMAIEAIWAASTMLWMSAGDGVPGLSR